MGFLGAPVVGAVEAIGNILDQLFTSDKEKLDLEIVRQRLNFKSSEIQAEINKIEASHRSLFVAGWRPFIGWVGGVSLCYAYLIHPLLSWYCAAYCPEISPPVLLLDNLFELVIALLGLGGLRTFEKVQGRSK